MQISLPSQYLHSGYEMPKFCRSQIVRESGVIWAAGSPFLPLRNDGLSLARVINDADLGAGDFFVISLPLM